MTSAGRFGGGLLVGLLAAWLFVAVTNGDDSATTTTTTPPTSAAPVVEVQPWFEQGEILIGTTVLLPRELTVEDGMAFFDYDLTGIAPTLIADHDQRPDLATPQGDYLVQPERWVLTTSSGQTVEGTTGPFDSAVRFELPQDDDQVASIVLVGWRVAVPMGDRVELTVAEGESGSVRRGLVSIETVLEQSISTIVQIDLDRTGDAWDAGVGLAPLDRRWRTSGRQGGGLQLIWEGDDAPTTVILEDTGFEMRPTTGEITVFDAEAGP